MQTKRADTASSAKAERRPRTPMSICFSDDTKEKLFEKFQRPKQNYVKRKRVRCQMIKQVNEGCCSFVDVNTVNRLPERSPLLHVDIVFVYLVMLPTNCQKNVFVFSRSSCRINLKSAWQQGIKCNMESNQSTTNTACFSHIKMS